jgi:heme/copper-type cytochrome/quinol oxidase subunit 3
MSAETLSAGQPARLPGDSGVWTFIIADMGAFALFFLIFMVGRIASPDLFEQSRQHLDVHLGLLNTVILLTSSLFMVRAVEASRSRRSSNMRPRPMPGSGLPPTSFSLTISSSPAFISCISSSA